MINKAYFYKFLTGIGFFVMAVVLNKMFSAYTNDSFGTLLINYVGLQCSWLALYFIVPTGKYKPDLSFGRFFVFSMMLSFVAALVVTYHVF